MKATDVLGCTGAVIAIFLATSWVPFFGPLISLLTPLPFLFYASKLGRLQGTILVVLSLLIIGLIASLLGQPKAVFLFIEYGLWGLVLAELFRQELSFGNTMLWGTAAMLLFGVVALFLLSPADKASPSDLFLEIVRTNVKETIQAIEQMEPDKEKVRLIKEQAEALIKIFEQIYLALAVMGMALVVWVNLAVSKVLFRLTRLKYPNFGALDQWHAPESMVWITIAAGFASFFLDGGIKFLAINALLVLGSIYAWQGLMIITFFFNKYRISAWVLSGFCFLIIIQKYLLLGVALAGLFDQWIDFRKLRQPVTKNPDEDLE
jgi:uncharacterized protein YybS (DUF2232 family)